jgi:DNA-binding MarR family transcriptional regulator
MDEPRWLDAAEQRTWRAFLDANRLLLAALDRQLQADSGLSLADYELLVRLSEAPDRRLRMNELAEATQYSRSRLSHAVSRLEAVGWVERRACPEDRRGLFAHLTDTGYRVLAAAAPGHVAAVRSLVFDPLTATQARALGQIAGVLRDELTGRGASPTG